MNVNFDAPKPLIKVFHQKGAVHPDIIQEILLGIEEEGLPYSLEEKDLVSALELAYKAAEASHLGVGIGVATDGLVLHNNRLKEDQPLFSYKLTDNEVVLRNLGGNAARLVKRMPFKFTEAD
jgi:mRNA-degrading endonuclease HigB of HigAB toxin-antitoxin module